MSRNYDDLTHAVNVGPDEIFVRHRQVGLQMIDIKSTGKKLIAWWSESQQVAMTVGCTIIALWLLIRVDLALDRHEDDFLSVLELQAYDQMVRFRGVVPKHSDRVVVVGIDDKSISEVGEYPWARSHWARFFNSLADYYHPAVVGVDAVFAERSPSAASRVLTQLLDQYSKNGFDSFDLQIPDPSALPLVRSPNSRQLAQVRADLRRSLDRQLFMRQKATTFREQMIAERDRIDDDRRLAEGLKAAGNVVLGFYFFSRREVEGLRPEQYDVDPEDPRLDGARIGLVRFPSDQIDELQLPQKYFGATVNREEFASAAFSQGSFTADPDADGAIRRYVTVVPYKKTPFASLAIQVAAIYLERDSLFAAKDEGLDDANGALPVEPAADLPANRQVQIAVKSDEVGKIAAVGLIDRIVPADRNGRLLIKYYGPSGLTATYPGGSPIMSYLSFVDVMERRTPVEMLQGKVLLVGASSISIGDIKRTPFQDSYPGVETHATVVQNILDQDFYRIPADRLWVEMGIVIGVGLILGFLLPRLRALTAALLGLTIAVVHLLVVYWLLTRQGILLTILTPVVQAVSITGLLLIVKYRKEEHKRAEMKGMFSHYVSPKVVDWLIRNPEKLKLGGQRQRLTVLFSDIRGFTTISEKMGPQELTQLLNNYLTPMSDLVMANGGIVDKYMGDAIMAIYGAPFPDPDHAAAACRTALGMLRQLNELGEQWIKAGLPRIDIGIGINTGWMSVGNMGSQQIFDYTVIGDDVNLASRLEGLNKQFGTHILIGEATFQEIKDKGFVTREIHSVAVKGKEKPIRLYELLAEQTIGDPWPEVIRLYHLALDQCRKNQWSQARATLKQLLGVSPDDQPSRFLLRQLPADPAAKIDDWVFRAESK